MVEILLQKLNMGLTTHSMRERERERERERGVCVCVWGIPDLPGKSQIYLGIGHSDSPPTGNYGFQKKKQKKLTFFLLDPHMHSDKI